MAVLMTLWQEERERLCIWLGTLQVHSRALLWAKLRWSATRPHKGRQLLTLGWTLAPTRAPPYRVRNLESGKATVVEHNLRYLLLTMASSLPWKQNLRPRNRSWQLLRSNLIFLRWSWRRWRMRKITISVSSLSSTSSWAKPRAPMMPNPARSS